LGKLQWLIRFNYFRTIGLDDFEKIDGPLDLIWAYGSRSGRTFSVRVAFVDLVFIRVLHPSPLKGFRPRNQFSAKKS
jgi:hypothetical protein